MDVYSRKLKKTIVKTRLVGLLSAILGVACIFFYYFKLLDPWVCIITLSYAMAVCFTLNSTYQEIFSGRKISKINLAFAVIFFLATIGIIVYAFVSGNIKF